MGLHFPSGDGVLLWPHSFGFLDNCLHRFYKNQIRSQPQLCLLDSVSKGIQGVSCTLFSAEKQSGQSFPSCFGASVGLHRGCQDLASVCSQIVRCRCLRVNNKASDLEAAMR